MDIVTASVVLSIAPMITLILTVLLVWLITR
jgi:hypothetical protein